MKSKPKVMGEPCTIPAWALANLVMAAGCGVSLPINAPEMVEGRLALGLPGVTAR